MKDAILNITSEVYNMKDAILKLIMDNADKETFEGETAEIEVSWNRTVCILTREDGEMFTDLSVKKEIPFEDILDIMSKKHDVPKDKIEFYYEGCIYYKTGEMCLEYLDGIIGYQDMIGAIKHFIESESFDRQIEKSNFKTNLFKEYAVDEKWRNKDKEYLDEKYVAIVRTKGNDDWYFNELFEYLEQNNQKDLYKIYQAREETKVMYIGKSKLNKIKNTDIPNKIKEDIEKVINKEENCSLCGNVTYVNTHPYVYDGDISIGRLYACPICLDLHDLRMSPDYDYRKELNGEEKMDMYDFVYEKALTYYKSKL